MSRPIRFSFAGTMIAFLLSSPGGAVAQSTSPMRGVFSPEELDQIVAPIALYPDDLLAQVLMASTYPLEIVRASRWLASNPGLAAPELELAVRSQDWDPSVTSLIGFPEVLDGLSANLDWTQDLGDAFLGQGQDLMDAIQRMRRRALGAGMLASTDEQVVTDDGQFITIVRSLPDMVYVPSYSSTVIYGSDWSVPPRYASRIYSGPSTSPGVVSFSPAFKWGFGLWGHPNWRERYVTVDAKQRLAFLNRMYAQERIAQLTPQSVGGSGNAGRWWHDPIHRRGVNYRTSEISREYIYPGATAWISRDQSRGFRSGRPGGVWGPSPSNVMSATGSLGHARSGYYGPVPGRRSAMPSSGEPPTALLPFSQSMIVPGQGAVERVPGVRELDRRAVERGAGSRLDTRRGLPGRAAADPRVPTRGMPGRDSAGHGGRGGRP